MSDCVFCDILAGTSTRPKHFDLLAGIASFQPIDPHGEGHRVFIRTDHDTSAADAPGWAGHLVTAAVVYANLNGIEEFNIITSAGRNATQTVPHLHVHLVPRYEDDGEILPWGKPAKDHKPKVRPEHRDAHLIQGV